MAKTCFVPKNPKRERGQSAVMLAIMMVGLIALVALAIDGGNVLVQRRIVQNAADSVALGGVHYMATSPGATEDDLLAKLNSMAEAHAVPDTDGVAGNEINDNVTAFYVDENGIRLEDCDVVGTCGGTVPFEARGLEVFVGKDFEGYFVRLLGLSKLAVQATAIAAQRAGLVGGAEGALFALGDDCSAGDKPIDASGSSTEIIGSVHSNSYIDISGSDNHFHGAVTYVNGIHIGGTGNQFEPGFPIASGLKTNPLDGVSTTDYAPGGSRVQGKTVYDLSSGGKVDEGRLSSLGLYDSSTGLLETGVYYAGNNEIELGPSEMHGLVTFVSANHIKISGSNLNLRAYTDDGMLFFSDKLPDEPCKDWVVDLSGSSGSTTPHVDHTPAPPCPYDESCWTDSDNWFGGIVYAPRGNATSGGSKSTFLGAIIAYSIKLNGSQELIVFDESLATHGPPTISLIE